MTSYPAGSAARFLSPGFATLAAYGDFATGVLAIPGAAHGQALAGAISGRGLRMDTATFEIRVVPTSCFVNAIYMVSKQKQHTSHVLGTMWSKGNSVGLPFVVWWR